MARNGFPDTPDDYPAGDPTQYADYGGTGGAAYSEYGPPTGYPGTAGPTERYPDPERPDLSRRASAAHLAFGIGEHICPGAALSRFEQNLAWNTLLDRIDNIRPVPEKDDYTHIPGFWLRALKQIHVTFDKVR